MARTQKYIKIIEGQGGVELISSEKGEYMEQNLSGFSLGVLTYGFKGSQFYIRVSII